MKRLIFALHDGSVHVTEPGPPRPGEPDAIWLDRIARKCCPEGGQLVAVMDPSDLPDRTHRNAWVWDGQRIVIDESRIRRDPPSVEAPQAGAVQARDPRVDTLGQQLAGQFEVVAREMWAEVNKIRDETLAEADRRILCTLEAIGVRSRAQAQGAIDLDAVPALARELRERGLPVDEQHIIAVADEHAARIYQRTAA